MTFVSNVGHIINKSEELNKYKNMLIYFTKVNNHFKVKITKNIKMNK